MMKKVLIQYSIPKKGIELLQSKGYEIIYPKNEFFNKEELISKISTCDALLSTFTLPIDSEIIKAGVNLKIISNYGAGFNNINIDEANKRNIVVTNTPNSVCEPTAELAFGLMIDVMRRISELDASLKSSNPCSWGIMENLSSTLIGKQLGIIGMGSIGKAIARRATAFGMKVFYHNRNKIISDFEKVLGVEYLSFEELLSTSDVISLNVPLNSQTHHMIGSEQFKIMKNSAYIINTARGAVINEDELVVAIKNKEIAGVGLDVFEYEPNINPELLKLKNVVLTPHIGTSTYEHRILIGQEASENIVAFFEGNPKNIVNL